MYMAVLNWLMMICLVPAFTITLAMWVSSALLPKNTVSAESVASALDVSCALPVIIAANKMTVKEMIFFVESICLGKDVETD